MALSLDQRCLWEGVELAQSAALFGSAPLLLVVWRDVLGWALGDILELVHVPGRGAVGRSGAAEVDPQARGSPHRPWSR